MHWSCTQWAEIASWSSLNRITLQTKYELLLDNSFKTNVAHKKRTLGKTKK